MLNKSFILFVVMLFLASSVSTQVQEYRSSQLDFDRMFNSNLLSVLTPEVKGVTKEYYFIDKYAIADITLKSGEKLNDVRAKIDLYNRYVILDADRELILDNFLIDSLNLEYHGVTIKFLPVNIANQVFLCQVLKTSDSKLSTDYTVLKRWIPYYVRPNYNPALDTGSKTGSVSSKKVYIILDLENNMYHDIPRGKRKFRKLVKELKPSADLSRLKKLNPTSERSMYLLSDLLN